MMDEIAKNIEEEKLGVYLEDVDRYIGCLLWMDDVVLINPKPREMVSDAKYNRRYLLNIPC